MKDFPIFCQFLLVHFFLVHLATGILMVCPMDPSNFMQPCIVYLFSIPKQFCSLSMSSPTEAPKIVEGGYSNESECLVLNSVCYMFQPLPEVTKKSSRWFDLLLLKPREELLHFCLFHIFFYGEKDSYCEIQKNKEAKRESELADFVETL